MESSSAPAMVAGMALVLLVVLILVLASAGAFTPADGGGIHIGIGR